MIQIIIEVENETLADEVEEQVVDLVQQLHPDGEIKVKRSDRQDEAQPEGGGTEL